MSPKARRTRPGGVRNQRSEERTGTLALDLGILVAALATVVLVVSALLRPSGPGSTPEEPAHAGATMTAAGVPGTASGSRATERRRASLAGSETSPAGSETSLAGSETSRERSGATMGSPPSRTGLDREIRVRVENGCGVTGAAASLASVLRRAGGFDVVDVGNAENFDFAATVVVDRTGRGDAARAVAQALGGAPIVKQRLPQTRFEVTVIVGYDQGRWTESPAGARP